MHRRRRNPLGRQRNASIGSGPDSQSTTIVVPSCTAFLTGGGRSKGRCLPLARVGRATTATTGSVSLTLNTSCGTPGSMKMKSPASFSTTCSSDGAELVTHAALQDVEHHLEADVDVRRGHAARRNRRAVIRDWRNRWTRTAAFTRLSRILQNQASENVTWDVSPGALLQARAAVRRWPRLSTGTSRNAWRCSRGRQIEMRLHRLCRIHVNRLHEPAGFIGADGQQCQIDRTETVSDVAKEMGICGVAGKENPRAIRAQYESAPERPIPIQRTTRREVVCRRQRDRQSTCVPLLPPIELLHMRGCRTTERAVRYLRASLRCGSKRCASRRSVGKSQ